MRVLIACEYSGRTRQAFADRGHEAWSCDLLPAEDGSDRHIVGDVFDVIRSEGPFDLLIGHPPCTFLANSGVRWLYNADGSRNEQRWANMAAGAAFFAALLDCGIPKIAVENPVQHRYAVDAIWHAAKTHDYRGPYFIQPWWFGDEAFKATGFTLKGLPPLTKPTTALTPPKKGTPEHKAWSVIHNQSPGPNRWKERSRTFPGIARAMAETWG